MRVLHVLNELKPSGAEGMLRAASPYWQAHGVEGHIYCTGDSLGFYAGQLREVGYTIHHEPFSKSPRFLWRFYDFLRQSPFDAIHIHPERASFWYALVARFAGHRNLTRTIHNVFPFKGALRLRRYFQRFVMRRLLGVRMIAISQSVLDTENGVYSNSTVLVPNWFDSDRYRPPTHEERTRAREMLGLREDCLVVLSVGGCWSYKNHPAILHALRQLPEEARVLYIHVGQEDEGHPERKLAGELGVADRASFKGIVDDILPFLHSADAFLMPSTYEGFGIAAVEAMGAGLPCILADVEGLRDFHACGDGIYWVSPTAKSVAQALDHFSRLPAGKRVELGLSLSSVAHSLFGIENGAGAYLQLYKVAR